MRVLEIIYFRYIFSNIYAYAIVCNPFSSLGNANNTMVLIDIKYCSCSTSWWSRAGSSNVIIIIISSLLLLFGVWSYNLIVIYCKITKHAFSLSPSYTSLSRRNIHCSRLHIRKTNDRFRFLSKVTFCPSKKSSQFTIGGFQRNIAGDLGLTSFPSSFCSGTKFWPVVQ